MALLLFYLPAAYAAPGVCPARATPLRFVDVFDGPVSDNATLIPDKAGAIFGFWKLAYVYEAHRQVNIRCKYADGESVDVNLAKPVQKCSYRILKNKTLWIGCQ